MRVLLDTNALIHLLDQRAPQSIQDRLKGLLQDIEKSRGQVVIPAPVVAEYLVNAGTAGKALLSALLQSKYVTIAPFDHLAAEECAAMHVAAKTRGHKRHPLPKDADWQKVKVDRQIVAIAKVRATRIVADDKDIHALAAAESFPVQTVGSLPLPGWAQQMNLEGVQPTSQQSIPSRTAARGLTSIDKPPPQPPAA
ncbi:type II toxin-antitoxin system VapC family toxin [Acidovorax sp.]|uniref:type II toxin-antitoxin system VapC family toxin n=1 Tax=Acidovorax sp. TaxID=1872122 RepID=UPI003D06299D